MQNVPLADLKTEAQERFRMFQEACIEAGFDDEWAAYRAEERGQGWPDHLRAVFDSYIRHLHNFYQARDGERGILG